MQTQMPAGAGLADEIFEAYPAPTLIVDGDVRLLKVNRAARAMFRHEPDGAPPGLLRAGDLLHCLDSYGEGGCGRQHACKDCVIRSAVGRALSSGNVHRVKGVMRTRHQDGDEKISMLASASTIHFDGKTHVVLTLEEVSDVARLNDELMEAEQGLRASEARLQTTIENITDGVVVSDLDGRLLHWNRAALDMHGFVSLDERRSKLVELADIFELSAADGTVLPLEQWPVARILRGEHLRNLEIRIRRIRGDWSRIHSYSGTLVRDADNKPMMAVVTISDITSAKEAEEQLRRANERAGWLARFPEENPDPVLRLGSDLTLIYSNQAARSALGALRLELGLMAPPPLAEAARQAVAEGCRISREVPCGDRFFSMSFCPAQDQVNVYGEDITEHKRAEEALRETDVRYRLLFQNMLNGFAYCRMLYEESGRPQDFVYLDVNGAFERLTGLRDVVGKRVSEVIPGVRESQPELFEIYERVAKTGQPESFEIHFRPLKTWFSISVYSPHADHFVAIFDNITDRKLAAERLNSEKERLAVTLGSIGDAVIATDEATRVTLLNRVAEELTGWKAEEAIGRPLREVFDIVNETTRRPVVNPVDRVLREGVVVGLANHTALVARDGTERPIADSAAPIRAEGGRISGVVLVFRDQTEERRAEQMLHEEKERLRLAQDAANAGVWGWDLRTNEHYWSERLWELYGLAPNACEPSHEPWLQTIHPEDRPRTEQALQDAVRNGTELNAEWRVRRQDGSTRWLMARGRPVRNASGEPTRYTGIVLDITERRQVEEALREGDRRKNQFLGMLSHELRNPLAPVRNALCILDRVEPGGDAAIRAKAVINRQVDHLARLVDDLLDVTRISLGKIELQRSRFDLAESLRRTVEDHRLLFADLGIALSLTTNTGSIWVDADETRIAQILGNLLLNSSKFTDAGGCVTVMVEEDGAKASITVKDNGVGIAPDMMDQIFDPFTQADDSLHRSRGGLGLGLPLARGLAELHHGTIEARSEGLGRGSEFVLRLPVVSEQPRTAAVDSPARPIWPRRILVIEDNRDSAQTLRDLLELEQHVVDVAYDGRQGVEKARSFKPEVIFCDIGLPGMDGYEVARALRADESLGSPILVALTGYGLPDDRRRVVEAGFHCHLVKPIDFAQLEQILSDQAQTKEPGLGKRQGIVQS